MRIQLPPIEWERHWHPWFAWHPVVTDKGMCVWLERVERKQSMKYAGYACDRIKTTHYRLPGEE